MGVMQLSSSADRTEQECAWVALDIVLWALVTFDQCFFDKPESNWMWKENGNSYEGTGGLMITFVPEFSNTTKRMLGIIMPFIE